jgi:hypothetical protein
MFEFLGKKIRQEKEIKGLQTGKEVKLVLFANDMVLCLKDPKDSTKKCLYLLSFFGQSSRIQNNSAVFFYMPTTKRLGNKYGNNFVFNKLSLKILKGISHSSLEIITIIDNERSNFMSIEEQV